MIFQWFSRNSNDFSMIYQTFSTSKLQNPSRALRIQWIFNDFRWFFNDFQWIGHVYIPFALPTILQNGHSSAGCQLMTSWSLKQCVSICIKANGAQGLTKDARTRFVINPIDKREREGLLPRASREHYPAWTRPQRGHRGSGSPWMRSIIHGEPRGTPMQPQEGHLEPKY